MSDGKPSRHSAEEVVALLLVLAGVMAAYVRLYYGVDVEDEAFYAALPYRFALGDTPLVHELNVQQFSAVLTLLPVKAWVWLQGGTFGLILFLRHLYFAFVLFIGWNVYLSVKRHTGPAAATLLALMPVLFVPFNIPTLSYNTMGMGLLSLGLLFQLRAAESSDPHKSLRAAGLAHGFACVAYPSLAVIPVLMLGLFFIFARSPRGKQAIAYGLPVVLIGAICGFAAVLIGFDAVMASINYTTSGPPSFVAPFQGVLSQLKGKALVLGWLVGAGLSFRFARWIFVPIVTALPVILFISLSRWEAPTDTLFFVIYLGAMAPCFALAAGDRGWARAVGIWVLAPAVLAALVFSFTSATGFWNSSLGWFPVSIFTMAFIAMAVRSSLEPAWGTWAMLLPLVAANGVLVFALYNGVYREPTIDRLTTRVASGPYAGLYTTPTSLRILDEVRADLARFENSEGKLLVYDAFSGGYLLTSMRPATNSIWLLDWPAFRPTYAEGYVRNANTNNVVLRMNRRCQLREKDEPLHDLVRSQHALALDKPCYQIFTGEAEP